MSVWLAVCAKELRETLRDRRTLLMMIVVPVLLYPVLLIVMEQMLLFGMRNLEAEASLVAVQGDAVPVLEQLIQADSSMAMVELTSDPTEAIRAGEVTAVAIIGDLVPAGATREATIIYDAASDRSNRGRSALAGALRDWEDTLLAFRLDGAGLPSSFAQPVAVADSSIALPEEVGGYTMGRILPLLLVVITLLGAFYPAIDLAAGEKERGTLETLLTAPVPPGAIVIGKFVTVALIGVVAAGLNLASMLLTFQTGVLQVTEVIGLEVSLPWSAIGFIFLTLVPLAVLFGSLFLGIAVQSSSFKEAQNALTPVYMVVLIPAMLPIFPGIDFGVLLAMTPVAGVSFFFRDLMAGGADPLLGFLVLSSTTAYALLALGFAARSFGNERVLFGSGERATEVEQGSFLQRLAALRPTGRVPYPEAAYLFVLGVALLFFFGARPLGIGLGERGLLTAQWLLLLVPAVLFVFAGRFDPVETLSLRMPSTAGLVGGVVLIAGAMPLVWILGWLQSFVLPIPWELLEGLENLVTADSIGRLAWLLLLLSITPAICEETVFRGVLLGSTRSLPPSRMILLNGVVFGAFHLSFETVIRFLPTATLGIVITWAVWRTGSLWVGIIMHALNNGTIVVLASAPALREFFSDPNAPPPIWLAPLGLMFAAVGYRILSGVGPHLPPTPSERST